ncbi:MAG: hypothetical protein NVV62_04380 [Terricaulis sp.]|nr:hypothetical protein [Terricaulis sp.]
MAGGALALMEIAADYGAAEHFGLTTLSTAIFRAWYAHQSAYGALQIAAVLLVAAIAFLVIERRARGRAGFAGGSARWRTLPRYTLSPLASAGAFLFCATLITLGALLPLGWLALIAVEHSYGGALGKALFNSVTLASIGALVTLALAAIIAVSARRGGAWGKATLFAAGMGYAASRRGAGAGRVFNVRADARTGLDWRGGRKPCAGDADLGLRRALCGGGGAANRCGAGAAHQGPRRFGAHAGRWPARRLWRVDLPIAAPSLAAAALILFVDILKELPATLIIRPFNFDTLAVIAYSYASTNRWSWRPRPACSSSLRALRRSFC